MNVGYHAIRESALRAASPCAPQRHEIDVVKIDGPFAHLDNRWRFRDVPGGSEVHFYIDYAFRSRMLALLMGACSTRRCANIRKPLKHALARSMARARRPPDNS